jgi:hypothetical protein
MRALIAYQSELGNTREVAEAVRRGVAASGVDVDVQRMDDPSTRVDGVDLLILGVSTRPQVLGDGSSRGDVDLAHADTAVTRWLAALPSGRGRPAAIFETIVGRPATGRAGRPLSRELEEHGWRLLAGPVAFVAKGAAGPLVWGESGHAVAWGSEMVTAAQQERPAAHL